MKKLLVLVEEGERKFIETRGVADKLDPNYVKAMLNKV